MARIKRRDRTIDLNDGTPGSLVRSGRLTGYTSLGQVLAAFPFADHSALREKDRRLNLFMAGLSLLVRRHTPSPVSFHNRTIYPLVRIRVGGHLHRSGPTVGSPRKCPQLCPPR
jgi:hypothetical protein